MVLNSFNFEAIMTPSLVMCLTIFFLLVSGSASSVTAQPVNDPNCRDVLWNFLDCTEFIFGYDSFPSRDCCDRLKDLNLIANQKDSRQRICRCVENLVNAMGNLIPSRVETLPTMCGIRLGFPISDSLDCTKIG